MSFGTETFLPINNVTVITTPQPNGSWLITVKDSPPEAGVPDSCWVEYRDIRRQQKKEDYEEFINDCAKLGL